jgi:hypothetical protein
MGSIDFKAKNQNGDWVFGAFLAHQKITPCPIYLHGTPKPESEIQYLMLNSGFSDWNLPKPILTMEVDPQTLCRFTGRTDKNNIRIYSSDIVKTKYGRLCVVQWLSTPLFVGWDFVPLSDSEKAPDAFDLWLNENIEVVGNSFDVDTKILPVEPIQEEGGFK